MIIIKGKEITSITIRGRVIAAVYRGAKKIWEAVRSCFGSGCWRDDRPWVDDEIWKD